jgi:predicted PurR-regulated permease PerM
MKIRSPYGLGIIVVFLAVIAIAATALSIDATLSAYAQNVTTTPQPSQNQTAANPQQIKNYLNQAIQALDSDNNTRALEQVDLAGDQLESMTGTADDGEDEDDDKEEGPGEDKDEQGDVDTNDQEDTP